MAIAEVCSRELCKQIYHDVDGLFVVTDICVEYLIGLELFRNNGYVQAKNETTWAICNGGQKFLCSRRAMRQSSFNVHGQMLEVE